MQRSKRTPLCSFNYHIQCCAFAFLIGRIIIQSCSNTLMQLWNKEKLRAKVRGKSLMIMPGR